MFPCPSTSTLPNISSGLSDCQPRVRSRHAQHLSYQAILPYSGGFLESETWIHPPLPPEPIPPCPLAPPAESALWPLRPPNPALLRLLGGAKKTPPEPRFAPAVDAMTCACDLTSGSSCACSAITDCMISRNRGFSWNWPGLGGRLEAVPIASSLVGGSVGRRERRRASGNCCVGNTNCDEPHVSIPVGWL